MGINSIALGEIYSNSFLTKADERAKTASLYYINR